MPVSVTARSSQTATNPCRAAQLRARRVDDQQRLIEAAGDVDAPAGVGEALAPLSGIGDH
jgi:hypothetical protein